MNKGIRKDIVCNNLASGIPEQSCSTILCVFGALEFVMFWMNHNK